MMSAVPDALAVGISEEGVPGMAKRYFRIEKCVNIIFSERRNEYVG